MKTRIILILTLISAIILSACSLVQAPATPTLVPTPLPTDTPVPTNTPLPTNTPIPTSTNTPVPTPTNTATPVPSPTSTATPNRTATAAVLSTQTAEAVASDFKANLTKLGITVDKGQLGWVQDDTIEINLDTAGQGRYQPFAEDLNASDFIIKTDVTWTAVDYIWCGWDFRSEPNFSQGQQYTFWFVNYSGLPGWDIELYNKGRFERNITEKLRWASALKQENGSTNAFIILAEGNKFTVYINGQRIGSFFDFAKTRSEGYFAFTAYQESGRGSCTYDNTLVWLLK
jgi:hypothetical protein